MRGRRVGGCCRAETHIRERVLHVDIIELRRESGRLIVESMVLLGGRKLDFVGWGCSGRGELIGQCRCYICYQDLVRGLMLVYQNRHIMLFYMYP
jgi:hypothetical protein